MQVHVTVSNSDEIHRYVIRPAESDYYVEQLVPAFKCRKKLDKQYTEDGLNLNAAGYKRWAAVLKESRYLK